MATLTQWAILAIGVGGIAVLFVLMAYVRSRLRNLNAGNCPGCGARIKSSFKHCPHCGADIDQ